MEYDLGMSWVAVIKDLLEVLKRYSAEIRNPDKVMVDS